MLTNFNIYDIIINYQKKEKEETMKWLLLREVGTKLHAVPEDLAEAVIQDLKDNYPGEMGEIEKISMNPEEPFYFDRPGMALTTRQEYVFEVQGQQIQMPACDLKDILAEIEERQIREINGKMFVKLHGFLACICLDLEGLEVLKSKILEVYAEAIEIAKAEKAYIYNALKDKEGVYIPKPEGYEDSQPLN